MSDKFPVLNHSQGLFYLNAQRCYAYRKRQSFNVLVWKDNLLCDQSKSLIPTAQFTCPVANTYSGC